MKASEFMAGYYASAKSESEAKALWSELVNISVDAMNKRIEELKSPGKAKLKAAAKKAGQEKVVEAAIKTGKLVVGGVPKKTVDLAEEKIDSRKKKATKTKVETKKEEEKPEPKRTEASEEKKEAYSMKVVQLTAAEKKAFKKADIKFIDYTDKAFAFIGDTKPVAEIMSKLNGRFNRSLSCGAGWIFAKTNKEAVFKSLGIEK